MGGAVLLSCGALFASQPIARWSFDEGTVVADREVGPEVLDGNATGVTFIEGVGRKGRALHFGQDGARVDMPKSERYAFDNSESFCVSFWLRTTYRRFCSFIMTKDKPGGRVSYSFCLGRERRRISFELWSWSTVKLVSRGEVADGRWHRVEGAYDAGSNQAFLIVDGKVEAARKVGKGGPKEVMLRLGDNVDAHQQFYGDLDDVTIASGVPEALVPIIEAHQRWSLLTKEEISRAQDRYLERMARPRFRRVKTAAEWQEHAAAARQHVLECMSLWPLPKRVPPKTHISGSIEHDAYTLKRIYWQTWPDYYASGYLYVPKKATFPAPAILCPHGHWRDGLRNEVVQARCISLATKGYVVLAVDSVHVYNWAAGIVPMTVMCWNNIRGVDLLCSLPEVDSDRLGVTGCSGGGQQTFYLMALEDRLDVAIPVCMVSQWRRIVAASWHHCRCNHVPGILTRFDTPELTACFAPRPALLICVTGDWTKWLPKEGFPEIQSVYKLFQASDRVKCTQYKSGHAYSLPMREEAYGWLNQWLKGTRDIALAKEPEHVPETPERLKQLDGPPQGRKHASTIAAEILARCGFDDTPVGADASARLNKIRDGFITLTHEVEVENIAEAKAVAEPEATEAYHVERFVITSEREIPVPTVIVHGRDKGARPAVILVNPDGKATLLTARWKLVTDLADQGFVVCVIDPRPFGELGLNRAAQDMNGIVFGRPELAVAAHDVKCVAGWLRSREDVEGARVTCVGFGDGAVVAIAAGLYDEGLAQIAALGLGDTYSSRDRLPRCPRILSVGDLPQLVAALAPRAAWIQGMNQPKAYEWTREAYLEWGALERFMTTDAQPANPDIVEWLKTGGLDRTGE